MCQRCKKRVPGYRYAHIPEPRFRVRGHAVERYIERVAPHLSYDDAVREILVRMAEAPLTVDPPPWTDYGPAWPGYGKTEGFLMLDEDTCLVVGVPKGTTRRRDTRYRKPKIRTVLTRPNRYSEAVPS